MDSSQGTREFLAEINVITVINHDNLVKLHGCCVEGQHRILVYPYLENGSLDKMLFGDYISCSVLVSQFCSFPINNLI